MKKKILMAIATLPLVWISTGLSKASDRITASDSQSSISTVQSQEPAQSKSSVQGVTRGNIRRRFNGIYTPPRASTVRTWVRKATTASPILLRGGVRGRQRPKSPSGTDANIQVPSRQVR